MKLLQFIHRRKSKPIPEPRIVEDGEERFIRRNVALCLVIIILFICTIGSGGGSPYIYKQPPYYTICYERGDIKYYDREDDKVYMRPGYKYCDTFLQTSTSGSLEGSCVDTGCNFADTPQTLDDEFEKLVGIRYFIRY